MKEITTNSDKFDFISNQLCEIIKCLKPEENNDLMTIKQSIDLLGEKIEKVKKNNVKSEDSSYESEYGENLSDLEFVKRRDIFLISGSILSILLTGLSYKYLLESFSFSFSFMTAFIVAILLTQFDRFILQGNSFKRISSNAVSSSILLLGFIVLFVGSFYIGNSLVTNREPTEEYTQPRVIERAIEQPKSATNDTFKLNYKEE